ncbi:hypothetical protein DH2020_013719 [Rehmannia glutinosa]|uniref:Beta-catenin-like protein 1 N-terminal domain-containing protein n=1 Tax=Rehmannia glutinosa TaxID=99300 RepID=A0ABR0X6S1_REHGL
MVLSSRLIVFKDEMPYSILEINLHFTAHPQFLLGETRRTKRRRNGPPPPQKRKRSASPPPPFQPSAAPIDLSLLEALEKSQQNTIETLDLKTLKKLALSLERRLNANTAARLRYPDNPDKFADSELELHDELQKLKILAGAPELYPDLVSLGTVNSITGLLNHDNTDIAIDAVTLLQDLTDADVIEDNDESAQVLVDALIENNAVELLIQNLGRLSDSDPDESAAIYNTLSTIENLIEVKPSVSELVCEKTKLLKWLQARIKIREFDSNKQYASEILAILLQNSVANQKRFGQMNGVDTLLQAVAMYKSKDPKTGNEEEMVENLFDCLCCLLMPLENKEKFVKAEGVELMIIIMNQKKLCYGSAIRALDFAMTNYPPACERFIDVMGLKTAFPAFMGTSQYSNRVKAETERLNQLELDDLELIAVILGHLWTSEHPRMRARIELLLKQQKLTKKDVKDILQEYHDNIGDLDGPEEKERAQSKIVKFISALK